MYENYSSSQRQSDMQAGLNTYISKIFGTMFLGLLVTALAALFTVTNEVMYTLVFGTPFMFVMIIAELVIVFVLSARVTKMSYMSAQILFYAYAIINGITLSSIFVVYNIGTVYTAFLTTAAAFGIMALYGMVTKKDLTKIGNILLMALIGVIISSVINMFIGSQGFDLLISFVAVGLFSGLVAYDTQRLKGYYYASANDYQMQRKAGIIGALSLYLDFINIFLYILRIFGNKRD